jgi:multiple sugar transport system permease protein
MDRPIPLPVKEQAELERQAIREQWRKWFFAGARYALILLVTLIFTMPFVWMLLSSFKTQMDITSPDILNFTPTLGNYDNVFRQYDFLLFMWNSFIVATLSTLFSLILGLPASYAIARYDYDWLGVILLTARIVPGITFLVPWFIIFSRIGLVGTHAALILSHMLVGLPFVVWVLVPFFESLPKEIEESARIDGATVWGTFLRVVLPLAVPGVVTAAIMSYIFSWNNFMFSLVLADSETKTLPVAIFNFITYASVDWGSLMAAAVVITLPIIVVTVFMQRYIVAGLSAGATKG